MSEVNISASGHLTSDPETTEVGGTTKTKFTIASNPTVLRDGQWQKLPPVFTTCVAWGRLGLAAANYRQGSMVVVEGVMRAEEYEGRDGTQKRFQFLKISELGRHALDRDATEQAHTPHSGSFSGVVGGYTPHGSPSPSWGDSSPHSADFGAWGQQ